MNDAAILINVDDREAERSQRSAALSKVGFQVHDAGASRALDIVEKHPPDLVVIYLTNSATNEICSRLKDRYPGVPLLQIAGTAPAAGVADTCLTEPVDAGVLIAMVRCMLRLRGAESALRDANARLESMQQELQRSIEDFQQFAYVGGHDLKEPIRAVNTFLELLEREAKDRLTETDKGYIAHIMSGARRMQNLVDDLLAYSRVGREKQTKGVVAMSAVVAWAIGDLQKQVNETGATVHVEDGLPKVWGDFAQLGQVIRNLLSNAMKFRRPDLAAEIQISGLSEHGAGPDQCVIRVRDNGIGIAPEYHERIFAPFKRLHGQEIPGTGMGLAVSRRILNMHDGVIWVESEPDRGSTFCLRLPTAAGRLESRAAR
jgi:light-regulated signal transduction histidine kinase (bacteriophytochrome)